MGMLKEVWRRVGAEKFIADQKKVNLNGSSIIGKGKERACYIHPLQPSKVIKVQLGDEDKQTEREIKHYKQLRKRKNLEYMHMPEFYGYVETDKGKGIVFDLIKDFNGDISQSMSWYFQKGYKASYFEHYLADLKKYLLVNRVMVSQDLFPVNVLFQRLSLSSARLVIIDGLGDHVFIGFCNNIPYFHKKKIDRRWLKFLSRLEDEEI